MVGRWLVSECALFQYKLLVGRKFDPNAEAKRHYQAVFCALQRVNWVTLFMAWQTGFCVALKRHQTVGTCGGISEFSKAALTTSNGLCHGSAQGQKNTSLLLPAHQLRPR